jgi:hypothetical protein
MPTMAGQTKGGIATIGGLFSQIFSFLPLAYLFGEFFDFCTTKITSKDLELRKQL